MRHFPCTFGSRKCLARAETLASQYGFCRGILVLITEGQGMQGSVSCILFSHFRLVQTSDALSANTADQPDCVDLCHVLAELLI